MDEVYTAARVVTSTGVHTPGWIRARDGVIVGVGRGADVADAAHAGLDAEARVRHLGNVTIVPGFVDVHVHGGGGASYPDGTAPAALAARDAHQAHGTTTTMASLVTAAPEQLLTQVEILTEQVSHGVIRGIHLEGPWLSAKRAGAHDTAFLRPPESAEIATLLEAAALPEGNAITMVTLAPELPGALAAITQLVQAGVRVAIGHTDADAATVAAAVDAGATVATHLCNAMRPIHHREPGPILTLLGDARVFVELIADGTHLHPDIARWAATSAGDARTMLVTDAMGAAACGDGEYTLGALAVDVRDGVARLAGTDTIAGSTATMDALFRSWVAQSAAPGENALRSAVQLTATTPARAMGWDDVGDIAVGKRADLVVLDAQLQVHEVISAKP